ILSYWTVRLRPVDQALLEAIHHDNVALANAWLRKGADANVRSPGTGTPALAWAAGESRPAMVRLLLAHGADVNATDPYGDTALMTGAGRGSLAIVQLLLSHGADVNAKAVQTALMVAAEENFGSAPVVELLLKHGADVDARRD